MKAMKCEMCTGTEFTKTDDGMFRCDYCGTKYTIERARKLMIEGTVQVDTAPQVNNLIKRGTMLLETEKWEEAKQYFDKALDMDPENGDAWVGTLLSMLRCTTIDGISTIVSGRFGHTSDIEKYSHGLEFYFSSSSPLQAEKQAFENVLLYASDDVKSELAEVDKEFSKIIEEAYRKLESKEKGEVKFAKDLIVGVIITVILTVWFHSCTASMG